MFYRTENEAVISLIIDRENGHRTDNFKHVNSLTVDQSGKSSKFAYKKHKPSSAGVLIHVQRITKKSC